MKKSFKRFSLHFNILLLSLPLFINSCQLFNSSKSLDPVDETQLPFLKNSANECYFLDEFMPAPNNLVTGKSNGLDLRYYTYNSVNYKDIIASQIVLSFYSKDKSCWSLYEEYYVPQ